MFIRFFVDPRNFPKNNWDAGSDSNVFQCFNPRLVAFFTVTMLGVHLGWPRNHMSSRVFLGSIFFAGKWWESYPNKLVIFYIETAYMVHDESLCPRHGPLGKKSELRRCWMTGLKPPRQQDASPKSVDAWCVNSLSEQLGNKTQKPGDGKYVCESHNTCGGEMVFWDWLCSKCIFVDGNLYDIYMYLFQNKK